MLKETCGIINNSIQEKLNTTYYYERMSRRRDDIRPIPAIQKLLTGDEFKNYICILPIP